MVIQITPQTPVVTTQTVTETLVSFVVTQVKLDLAENQVSLTVDCTDNAGVISTQTIVLNAADSTTFTSVVSTAAGQTLAELGVSACVAPLTARFGITGTPTITNS